MGRFDKLFGRSEPVDWSQLRRTVLARSESYEGFERDELDDPRARELAAAGDIEGLRRLLIGRSRQGDDGYDLVAIGEQRGGWWEFRGFDVADKKDKSALLHRSGSDFDERISPHGLFWNQEDAEAFQEAVKGVAVVPIFRFRRSGIVAGQSIYFQLGNEYNPGNPFGRVVLHIDEHDRARLEHYWPGNRTEWEGDVAPGLAEEIKAAFARGNFPHRPQAMVPGGATMLDVELVTDDKPEYLMIYEGHAREIDGYREGYAMLDALAVQLSEGAYKGGKDTLPPSVSNVRKLP